MATTKATEIGQKIGKAIARDVLASEVATRHRDADRSQRMGRDWTGLSDQDADQAIAAGIEQDTPEWDEMVAAARAAYREALA